MSKDIGKWRELPRSIKSSCPKLFYNFAHQQGGFTIGLTDLVGIWQCSMTRTEVADVSIEQHSSIDPSESTSQARVLLDRLQQSLESGDNFLFRYETEASQTVYLRTELDLPKPLKPLAWTFKLDAQDASELAEQLLRPCLREASIAKQKLESLLRVIKDKDHVMSRLLEKIDNSAIDLGLIFPGITGLRSRRGKVTVAEARKHVPGMTEFDLDRWTTAFADDSAYSGFDHTGMNNLVAGCEKCPRHTTKQHADWLQSLPKRGQRYGDVEPSQRTSLKRKTSQLTGEDDSTETEDEFERQPTPPHLKKGHGRKKIRGHSHSSSSNEDDSRLVEKTKIGKLRGGSRNSGEEGRPGGEPRRRSSSSLASHITEATSSQSYPLDDPEMTNKQIPSSSRTQTPISDTHETNLNATPKSHHSRSTSTTPRKLGRIGRGDSQRRSQTPNSAPTTPSKRDRGHAIALDVIPEEETSQPKNKSPSIASTKSASSTASPSPSPSPNMTIEQDQTKDSNIQTTQHSYSNTNQQDTRDASQGLQGRSQQQQQRRSHSRNLTPVSTAPPPIPKLVREETIEEKANRRRAELKRQLSSSSNVGGGGSSHNSSTTRKKRKF